MKTHHLCVLAALCLLAAAIVVINTPFLNAAGPAATPAADKVSRHREATAATTTTTSRRQPRTNETQLQQPDTACLLAFLSQAREETIDLQLALRHVESFRLASPDEIPRLAEAIAGNPLPLAKGLIAQSVLRIPDPQVVQAVFNAACTENEPAAREAILLAFQSIELPATHELLTTALAASKDPQILSFIHAFVAQNPQPESTAILAELEADETTPPACQEAIRDVRSILLHRQESEPSGIAR